MPFAVCLSIVASSFAAERIAVVRALGDSVIDATPDELASLEARRNSLRAELRTISKDIKKETRKRQRLMANAGGLTDDALSCAIHAQSVAMAKAKANVDTQAKSSSI